MRERERLVDLGIIVPAPRARSAFDRYIDKYFPCLLIDAKTRAQIARERVS